jgi:hypothetical protein
LVYGYATFNNSPVFDSFHYPILTGNATLKEYWAFVNAIKVDDWVVDNNIRIAPFSLELS